MKLESQYKQYQEKNPESKLSFKEWQEKILAPLLAETVNQVQSDSYDKCDGTCGCGCKETE